MWCVCWVIVDMTKPVHRHLMEQKWRKEGGLDLLVGFSASFVDLGQVAYSIFHFFLLA